VKSVLVVESGMVMVGAGWDGLLSVSAWSWRDSGNIDHHHIGEVLGCLSTTLMALFVP
jgi:hypothetical protein